MQILYKDVWSSLMLSESSSSSLPVGVPARLGTSSSTPVNQLTPCNPHPICPVSPPLWFWWRAGGGSPLCAVAKGARAGWPSNALVKRPACQSVWGKSGWLARPSVYTHSYIYSVCVCVCVCSRPWEWQQALYIHHPPPPSPSCRSDFGKQPPSFPKCLVYFHPIILLIVTSPLETIFVTLGRWLQDIRCEYTILCVMYTKNLFFSWLHLSGISHSVLCYLLFVCNCLWNVPFLSENCFYTFFFPAYTLKKKGIFFIDASIENLSHPRKLSIAQKVLYSGKTFFRLLKCSSH